ncbi:MAG: 50S ribosomal protein L18Ae [Thermoplasmata archaeon]
MPTWKVSGEFYARRNCWQAFSKTRDAPSPEAAREWVVSVIGGCHHLQRRLIRISSVEPV